MIVADLLRRLMFDPVRFQSVRDFGVFCLVAVLAVPAVSAIAGAASRGDWGTAYWTNAERWFLGNALTQLIVTPFIFYWLFWPAERRQMSSAQWIEALALLTGLVISLAWAFQPPTDHLVFTESRLYAPMVFLFWAAVRFGMPGATAATAILTCFAVAATLVFEGPHSEQTRNAAASGMQQFLLLRVAPLYLVAVLLEQSRRIQHSLSDSERRFRDMADNAPVMIWLAGAEGLRIRKQGLARIQGSRVVPGTWRRLGAGLASR